jgi:hypothetical protein
MHGRVGRLGKIPGDFEVFFRRLQAATWPPENDGLVSEWI